MEGFASFVPVKSTKAVKELTEVRVLAGSREQGGGRRRSKNALMVVVVVVVW
jgi:hypothetical protein